MGHGKTSFQKISSPKWTQGILLSMCFGKGLYYSIRFYYFWEISCMCKPAMSVQSTEQRRQEGPSWLSPLISSKINLLLSFSTVIQYSTVPAVQLGFWRQRLLKGFWTAIHIYCSALVVPLNVRSRYPPLLGTTRFLGLAFDNRDSILMQ
jgi:hypothetical protein